MIIMKEKPTPATAEIIKENSIPNDYENHIFIIYNSSVYGGRF